MAQPKACASLNWIDQSVQPLAPVLASADFVKNVLASVCQRCWTSYSTLLLEKLYMHGPTPPPPLAAADVRCIFLCWNHYSLMAPQTWPAPLSPTNMILVLYVSRVVKGSDNIFSGATWDCACTTTICNRKHAHQNWNDHHHNCNSPCLNFMCTYNTKI